MDKWSVIIPTIWKSGYTEKLLTRFSQSKYVGEIILIDNAGYLKKEIILPKLVHIKEKENTFVNPAWNKGVDISKYDYVTIANDDILFDVDEYYYYLEQILELNKLENLGFIGSHSDNYKLEKADIPKFEIYDNKNNKGGWGCLFSFHKSKWIPIPDKLKIWFGDNWIHMNSNQILQLRGIKIETNMSTSSDLDEVRDVRDTDVKNWNKLLKYGKITN